MMAVPGGLWKWMFSLSSVIWSVWSLWRPVCPGSLQRGVKTAGTWTSQPGEIKMWSGATETLRHGFPSPSVSPVPGSLAVCVLVLGESFFREVAPLPLRGFSLTLPLSPIANGYLSGLLPHSLLPGQLSRLSLKKKKLLKYSWFAVLCYWFCHTSTWICHGYTHVPNPEPIQYCKEKIIIIINNFKKMLC